MTARGWLASSLATALLVLVLLTDSTPACCPAPPRGKPVVNADKLERARSMIAKGLTVREAATRLKVGKTALYEALRLAATTHSGPRCDPSPVM